MLEEHLFDTASRCLKNIKMIISVKGKAWMWKRYKASLIIWCTENLRDQKTSKINKIYGAFSFYCRKRRCKYFFLVKFQFVQLSCSKCIFFSNFIFVSSFNFCVYLSSLSMHWDEILYFSERQAAPCRKRLGTNWFPILEAVWYEFWSLKGGNQMK